MAQPQRDPQQILAQHAQQFNQQMEQQLIAGIIDQCSKKCLGTRGNRLDDKEQHCVSNCYDRYLDTRKVVMQEAQSE